MIIPISVKTTIATCIQIQEGGMRKPYDGDAAEAAAAQRATAVSQTATVQQATTASETTPAPEAATVSETTAAFYERAYSGAGEQAERGARWRALGARGKADHVIALCRRAGLSPASTLEVGCGDGSVLSELHRRGFGGRLSGLEISEGAVRIARARPEIESVATFDGLRVPAPDGAYELGVLFHVLEHVQTPAALLAEVARACRAVVIEVPLEANLSALRRSRRGRSQQVGHLQRLSRTSARAIVAQAGLRIACELEDPLPLEVHLHFAEGSAARVAGAARWALRGAVHRGLPPLARRLFTLHYAALCLPPDA